MVAWLVKALVHCFLSRAFGSSRRMDRGESYNLQDAGLAADTCTRLAWLGC